MRYSAILILFSMALELHSAEEAADVAYFYIGGFFGNNIFVNIKDDNVLYRISKGPPEFDKWEVLTISELDRKSFIESVTALGIANWEHEYNEKNVADGTQWAIRMSYHGIKLETHGSNKYPNRFVEFQNAVSALLKGREFK